MIRFGRGGSSPGSGGSGSDPVQASEVKMFGTDTGFDIIGPGSVAQGQVGIFRRAGLAYLFGRIVLFADDGSGSYAINSGTPVLTVPAGWTPLTATGMPEYSGLSHLLKIRQGGVNSLLGFYIEADGFWCDGAADTSVDLTVTLNGFFYAHS